MTIPPHYMPVAFLVKTVLLLDSMRTYQQLSQNDPAWKNILLGNSSTVNLGQAGCYVTSFCVVADYFGKTITPDQMNQKLKDANLFVQEDLISNDNDLQQLFSDITYQGTDHYESIPADLKRLQTYLADETLAVILCIDLGNDQVHFTPAVDCDGKSRVQIMNVWDGKVEDLGTVYGDPAKKILKFVVYKGTPDPLVCDKKSVRDMLVTKATSTDVIGNYLQFTPLAIASAQFGDEVIAKIKTLEEKANSVVTYSVQVENVPSSTTSTTATPTGNDTSGLSDQAKQNLFQAILDYFFTKKGVSN